MLNRLYQELVPERTIATIVEKAPLIVPARTGTRDSPVEAVLVSRKRLNRAESEKETWHFEFDLPDAGVAYEVGDSFGVFVRNDPFLVQAVIAAVGASPETAITGRRLQDVLTDSVSLNPAPDRLFQLISYLTG